MHYWLIKSEPTAFSIHALARAPKKTTCWDGVRNYQARNFMRDEMKKGDLAFFYHSNCDIPGIVGIVRVVREAYPDHTAFDPKDPHFDPDSDPQKPRWFMVDVQLEKIFPHIISLEALRCRTELSNMLILRPGNRLSVTPVDKKHWDLICKL